MPEHMGKILEAVENRIVEDYFSLVVNNDDIATNDYNLSVSSYITAEDTREVINIQQLNKDIEVIVTRQAELRKQIDAIVADLEGSR